MEWRNDKIGLGYGYNSSPLMTSSNYFYCTTRAAEREKETSNPLPFHQATLRMEKAGDLEEFMDAEERSDSECSSGCQSGWTLYLGQSQENFTTSLQLRTGEEEEEDLSMLSDASSGPPLVHENNISYCCFCYNEGDGCLCNHSFLTLASDYREKRRSSEEEKEKKQSFSLEDTASSPLFCCKATKTISSSSKKKLDVLEQSHSLSESHFKGKIELGYLHSFCTCESSTGLQIRR